MEYVYIGIFSSIFNWVFEKILSPVFKFIADLLSKALSWLFNTILKPLLKEVLWPLIQDTLDLIIEILAEALYSLYAGLLKMIDTMNSAFNYFIGLSDVTYKGTKMPLLDAMFQIDGLRTGFLLISCIGLSIACMLAVIAVIQSTLDLDFDNRRPVSRVLSAFFKSFIQLLTVEFVVIFMIKLSGLILKGVDQAVGMVSGSGSSTTLARMIFVVSSMNAARDAKWNLTGTNSSQVGIADHIRSAFYSASGADYTNTEVVEKSFYFSKFDYLIGFALAIFLLIVMACCMVVFVQRIFDMLVLYLVSPLFVGMIPLDDGERFGKWREMFIGKCFSGFGMVMTMKLYIMLCPSIMSSSLTFSSTSTELNYLTKMVFLLGGAWAVLKSGNMITILISQGAGYSEQQTSGSVMAMGMAGMSVAGGVALKGAQMAGGAAGMLSGRSRQAFADSKYQASGSSKAGTIPGIGEGTGGSTGGSSGFSGGSGGSGGSGSVSGGSGGISGGTGGTTGSSTPAAKYSRLLNFGHDAKGNSNRKIAGLGFQRGRDGSVRKVDLGLGSLKRGTDGKMHFDKARIPLLASFKRNQQTGKVEFHGSRILGMKMGHDENGTHLKQLGLIGYRGTRDENGKYQMTNLFGNMFKREKDNEGKYTFTNFMGLVKKEKQEDGKFHISSVLFGAGQANRVLEDGKLNYSAVRILGINVHKRDDVIQKNRENKKGD